jgi:restriction system protein
VAVPDYQSFMRPVLMALSDGQTWKMRALYARVATDFSLTDSDMAEMLPSGKQATYANRIGWAKTYLAKAGAVESLQRGTVQITENGRGLLKAYPDELSTRILGTIPAFAQFLGVQTSTSVAVKPQQAEVSPLSPEEQLDLLYADLTATLKDDLLLQLRELTPAQFERLVVQLLVAIGYGGTVKDAGAALGKSGDNGIDGMIKQDPLGLDRVYLQAKRWVNTVHSPEIRTFVGSLTFHRASKGVFITTSSFSGGAESTAAQIGNIILIGGEQLSQLMIEYGVGVITRSTYLVRRVDSEFFEEI